ncbi:ABC transporter ATP-binding protein [Micromonospora carbonacea]|uniref:Peptide/nickel transport system ATP-binding protein n=1 Tax=Micromonospora carbonacea TaxID=47853 RepID=A0A1C4V8L3_9ACTN|nr:oligopeptide/dipeptide ABC transporter ATP-binding protein [Micromonospora carbonacea]SCE80252.1 peptide/nickel transport system ATP-binding protein [Micromonospora carbonacea]
MTERIGSEPVMAAERVSVRFAVGRGTLTAVDDVSLALHRGRTVALVGESGSGKSTLAMAMMRATVPNEGRILFQGRDITHLPERRLKPLRRHFQMVFQDPYASLDPRMTVGRVIAEPLRAHGLGNRQAIRARVTEVLDQVGLPASAVHRYPAQFSGGQRQRISIARALAARPSVIVADEPVSALDVSIQAQIVSLLGEIQASENLAYLVIAHDLALVHHISDRVVVLYLGRVVEEGPTTEVVSQPQHPYTAALLSATPTPDDPQRERIVLSGDPPSPIQRPAGCVFHTRCPIARPVCATDTPTLDPAGPNRAVACFFPGELASGLTIASAPVRQKEGS